MRPADSQDIIGRAAVRAGGGSTRNSYGQTRSALDGRGPYISHMARHSGLPPGTGAARHRIARRMLAMGDRDMVRVVFHGVAFAFPSLYRAIFTPLEVYLH